MNPDSDARYLSLVVAARKEIAENIFMFDLRPENGSELPAFTPGSHITVVTPSGQKRRYSLCNAGGERDRYVIAVKREERGRGGSVSFTTQVKEGDRVEIERPANEFEMSGYDPAHYIFIAGGIGITPIRAMINHLLRKGQTNFTLYYFTRTPEQMAFRDELLGSEYEGKVVLHHDAGDPNQAFDLWPVLEEQKGAHLYCCGPRPLMDAVRDMTGHWSDSSVHFEDFVGATATRADDVAFTVKLAGSGKEFEVPVGVSILDVLRQNGYALASSCESGTCGTCRTRYTEGEPDHRDLVLSEREKKSEMMICVSRAKSPYLTLDV
jgi:phthalate 4,5-dioxygenase reductase subunit